VIKYMKRPWIEKNDYSAFQSACTSITHPFPTRDVFESLYKEWEEEAKQKGITFKRIVISPDILSLWKNDPAITIDFKQLCKYAVESD